MLLDPRGTLLELGPDARERERADQHVRPARLLDGWILLLVYLLGAKLVLIMDAIADAQALHGLSSLQALTPLVFVILPWVLTGFALEILLGRALDSRDDLLRVPLVVVALLAEASSHFMTLPGPAYAPDLVGAVLCLVSGWSLRDVVGVRDAPPPAAQPAARPPVFALLARIAGLLLCVLFLVNFARQVHVVRRDWTEMAPVSRGEAVPAFEIPRRGGGVLADHHLKGKISVLVFWTTWCGNCDAEMPGLASLHERFAAQNVEIIAVNCDRGNQRLKVREYETSRPLPFTVAYDDGRVRSAMRVKMYPHTVIVDGEGTVRYVHLGTVREGTLASEIRALLREGD